MRNPSWTYADLWEKALALRYMDNFNDGEAPFYVYVDADGMCFHWRTSFRRRNVSTYSPPLPFDYWMGDSLSELEAA